MAGMNLTFEELPLAIQEPKFSYLDEKLKNELDLSLINIDTLKILELYLKMKATTKLHCYSLITIPFVVLI